MKRYDERFFELQSGESFVSARIVLDRLFASYRPESIVDFGSGVGTWLVAADGLGVKDVLGLDGAGAARQSLRIDPGRFQQIDLSERIDLGRQFDLVMSLEVAEHLPPEKARTFVGNLTRHADMVLFSAALPCQGGAAHLNENWIEYWDDLFAQNGWQGHDVLRGPLWHNDDVAWWYRQNIVIFTRVGSDAARFMPPPEQLRSLVHPEMMLQRVHEIPPNPLRSTLEADLAHQRAPQGEAPGYGPEYDYPAPPRIEARNMAELWAIPRWTLPAPLADALAPLPTESEPSPLTPMEHPPAVLGIGVQKAGTTWLADLLNSHPETFVAPGKEVNFFNRRAFGVGTAWSGRWATETAKRLCRNYARRTADINPDWMQLLASLLTFRPDAEWYAAIWRMAVRNGRMGVDITPEYAMVPRAEIETVLGMNPDLRVILLLRDPLERIKSHVRFVIDAAPDAARFANDLALCPSVVRRSRYDLFCPDWIELVPSERLLIARSENIARDPARFVERLSSFLSIDPDRFDPEVVRGRSHRSKAPVVLDARTEETLSQWLRPATEWIERHAPLAG